VLTSVGCPCCHALQMRFPELYEQVEGDTDKVASRVAWEYLEGMNWVLRYYACGPAALDWRQQQHDTAVAAADHGSSDAAGVPGASWSWCYSFHYAPLMQVGCADWLQLDHQQVNTVQDPCCFQRQSKVPVCWTVGNHGS